MNSRRLNDLRKRNPRIENQISPSLVRYARPRQTRASLPLTFLLSDAEQRHLVGKTPYADSVRQGEKKTREHSSGRAGLWRIDPAQ
jgi:hypothetical protein